MAEPNGTPHPASTPGELSVRVGLLERRDIDIEKQVNAIRDTMATKADITGIVTQIQALAAQQTSALRPNYGLMVSVAGVAILFLTMVGGFAYWPINTATSDLKLAVIGLSDNKVQQKQYDADLSRLLGEQTQLRNDLTGIEGSYVQQQRIVRDENEFNALRDRAVLRDEFAAVVKGRGVVIDDLRERVRRLEDMAMKH